MEPSIKGIYVYLNHSYESFWGYDIEEDMKLKYFTSHMNCPSDPATRYSLHIFLVAKEIVKIISNYLEFFLLLYVVEFM